MSPTALKTRRWYSVIPAQVALFGIAPLVLQGQILDHIEITGPANVKENDTADYVCTAVFADGQELVVTEFTTWTIDPATAGTFVAPGTLETAVVGDDVEVQIQAHYTFNETEASDTFDATVINIAWVLDVVDPDPLAGFMCELRYAPDGTPTIVYERRSELDWSTMASAYELRLAQRIADEWVIETLPFGDKAGFPAFQFAPDGRPSIAYYDGYTEEILYAQFDGANWAVAVAAPCPGLWYTDPWLAFGADNEPLISFGAHTLIDEPVETPGEVRLARRQGDTWIWEVVATAPPEEDTWTREWTGVLSGVGFGGDGELDVAYWAGNFYLAELEGTEWSHTLIATGAENGWAAPFGFAYTSGGEPSLSYGIFTTSPWEVVYAVRDESGIWTTETAGAGEQNALAYSPDGSPSCVLVSAFEGLVLYASQQTTGWEVEAVDVGPVAIDWASGSGIWEPTLAFGPDGLPAVAYSWREGTEVGGLFFARKPPCEGDANGDGTVDPLDSGFVLSQFGCMEGNEFCDAADQNGDGVVDPLDVGYVLSRFGPCP